MAARHPPRWARSPCGQMRCWIRSECRGVQGGIGFGSATFRLRARDKWIGWSADALVANIRRVIFNHRFLLLPGFRAGGLASRALRIVARRATRNPAAACARRRPNDIRIRFLRSDKKTFLPIATAGGRGSFHGLFRRSGGDPPMPLAPWLI